MTLDRKDFLGKDTCFPPSAPAIISMDADKERTVLLIREGVDGNPNRASQRALISVLFCVDHVYHGASALSTIDSNEISPRVAACFLT